MRILIQFDKGQEPEKVVDIDGQLKALSCLYDENGDFLTITVTDSP